MDEKKIIYIEVPIEEGIKQIAEMQQRVEELNESLKSNTKGTDEQRQEYAKTQQQVKAYKSQIALLTRETQNSIKERINEEGSLNQLQAQLSKSTQEYNAMSKAQRESAEGKELQASIRATSDELKEARGEIGNYTQNVGDYEGAINRAMPAQLKMLQSLAGTGGAATTAAGGFKAAGAAASAFGKQLLALLANPVVLIIAGIAAAVAALVAVFNKTIETIKGNEEQANRLREALAPLQSLTVIVTRTFERFGEVLLKVAEWFGRVIGKATELLGIDKQINETAEQFIALERRKSQLAIETRRVNEESATRDLEIAKARNEAARTDIYSAEQRIKFMERAIQLEEQNSLDRRRLARETFEIAKIEAARTKNSVEANEQLSQARIAMTQAETEYYTTTRRLQSNLATFTKELRAEQSAAAAARAKQAEDERIAHEKAMEDLRERIEAEMQVVDETMKLRKIVSDMERAELEVIKTNYQNRLQAVEGSLQAEYELRKKFLEFTRDEELKEAKKRGLDLEAIKTKYDNAELELDRQKIMAKAAIYSGLLQDISDVFGKSTTMGKVAASASIAIDSISGAFAAFTGMTKTIPGIAGLIAGGIAAAGVVARGSKAIRDVWKVSEKTGASSIPSQGRASIPSIASTPDTTSRMAAPLTGVVGGAGSGSVLSGASIAPSIGQSDAMKSAMLSTFSSMPQPVVTVKDINEGQRKVEVIENIGGLKYNNM